MSTIQQQFNSNNSPEFTLTPGEYEGPLTIDRPCTIDGANSTLWSNKEPILIVNSTGVIIKNIRVEYTGQRTENANPIAIITSDSNTKLVDVEVNGAVKGFANEAEEWTLPSIISLGDFAANKENSFSVDISAAGDAEIKNNIKNVRLSSKTLSEGNNNITFTTDELKDNTILYGEIFVNTSVSRRIYVTGKAMNDAPEHHESTPVSTETTASLPVQVETPNEIIAPMVSTTNAAYIKRGQRISVKELEGKVIKIIYEHKSVKQQIEIDGYIFMLQENGKVQSDNDLIFFGNTETSNGAIKSSSAGNQSLTLIELNKLEDWVNKVEVCYSIYGNEPNKNFSLVECPLIRIIGGDRELYRFELSNLNVEKTVVAIELYRYKGEWKINFIGSGYKSGLNLLCENYGVNVE